MDLDRLLELNNNYNDSHNKVVDLLQSILEKGELTEGDYGEIQDNYSKNEDNYNELNKAENDYMKSDFELKLETLQNTKIDLDVDSVLDLLTNGGRTSAMYKDDNGNIVLDAAKIGELNQVKVLVDENNKKIASIIADTEVEQADGSKVKLKVLFSTLDQKVDGITTTVGEVSGIANDANSKATANTQKISQINQTVDGITSTVKQVESVANSANGKADDALTKASQIEQTVDGIKTTVQNTGAKVDGSIKETYNEFYLSSSNTTTTGGSWAKTAPAPQTGKYIWLRDVYVTNTGDKTYGNPVCITGAKGDKGDQGTGVKQVQILYFVHTSKTSAPSTTATGWTTSIPAYQTGKYLWQVNKITYTNNSTAFTTPVYLSSWEAENKAETAVSIANQTSEKFEWIVKKGSTASGILLTDKAIEAIANSSIKLKASQITLEGLVTANGNFKILEDGSIEATNGKFTGEINADKGKISSDLEVDGMNVSGNLSADTLDVRKINCPDLSIGLTSDVNITVNPGASNTTNIFSNGATFTSLQTCIESIPKNLNGHTVSITVAAQISENILIKGFNGGTIYIKFNKNNGGYIFGHNCSAELLLQGEGTTTQTLVSNYKTTGNVNMRTGGGVTYSLVQTVPPGATLLLTDMTTDGWGYTTYDGKSGWMSTNTSYMVKDEVYQTTGTSTAIQPGELLAQDGKYYAAVFRNCPYAAIFDLEVYGKTGNELNYAIGSIRGSYVDLEGVKVSGSENGIAAERGGRVFQSNTTGKVNGIAQNANHSGTIYIQDGTTINGTISKDNSSQIIYSESGVNKDTTSNVGTNDNTTTATSTVTITSNSGNSYRHNVYTGWKNDNTVRQGDYGYGDCDGIWLFGTQFASKLKGKNITKITLTVTRQQGGVYGAVTCTLKMHNYSSQPGGAPTYVSGWSTTFSVAVNNTTTITITDSAVLTAIKNGTCQGFGLQGAYDSSHYAVFSGNCTVVATIN